MPIYKITYTEFHRVSKEYIEEFDTSSVEHWNDLKSRVQDLMDEEEYSLLPELPPVDTEVWLEVYKRLNGAEYKQEALED